MKGLQLYSWIVVAYLSTNVHLTELSMVPVVPGLNAEIFELNTKLVTSGGCPNGYFKCNATIQCIAQKKNCDGITDCDDGSDEWDCEDESDSLFWDHLFRKRPGAELDEIPMVLCDWDSLNSSCKCRSNELHCQYGQLTSIPVNLPTSKISLLDLTGNIFSTINDDFFRYLPDVETLVLKHCLINMITPFAFDRLRHIALRTLYLDNNMLKVLPENFFPPGNCLEVLILAGNKITKLHGTEFNHMDSLEELDLRDNCITTFGESVFKPLHNLQILYLNGNHIHALTASMLPVLPRLMTLSLADNQIRYISREALRLPALQNLFLSGNRLSHLHNQTFKHLPKLMGLNLNDNEIDDFQLGAFDGVENLTSLYLMGNSFKTLDVRVLQNLNSMQYIYFSWFHLCRAAMHVRVCEPRGDGISSDRHLLDNPVLRTSVWIMAIIAIVGNLLVLFGRFVSKRRNSQSHIEHSLYLRHLAASDLLMGIYLAIIATADIQYRGEYLLHEEKWRHSTICQICGVLSTLSCQSSTLLLTLVTWDRLISVTRPLLPRASGKVRAAFRLSALWAMAAATALAPLSATDYFGNHFYGNNGVCLSLHIHDPYARGWEYSAAIFILVNTLSLVFIGLSYLRMLQAIRGSGEAMRSTLSGRENAVARRFAIIVATDCACWLPVIIVKLTALAGVKISPSLYGWLAVLVLPVNSALNPVLYTLTTTAFKQQATKFFYSSVPCGASIHDQTGYELSISLPQNGGNRRFFHRRVSTKVELQQLKASIPT